MGWRKKFLRIEISARQHIYIQWPIRKTATRALSLKRTSYIISLHFAARWRGSEMRHNMLPLLRIFSHVSCFGFHYLPQFSGIFNCWISDSFHGEWSCCRTVWSDSVSCIGNQLFRRSLRVDTRIYRRRRREWWIEWIFNDLGRIRHHATSRSLKGAEPLNYEFRYAGGSEFGRFIGLLNI